MKLFKKLSSIIKTKAQREDQAPQVQSELQANYVPQAQSAPQVDVASSAMLRAFCSMQYNGMVKNLISSIQEVKDISRLNMKEHPIEGNPVLGAMLAEALLPAIEAGRNLSITLKGGTFNTNDRDSIAAMPNSSFKSRIFGENLRENTPEIVEAVFSASKELQPLTQAMTGFYTRKVRDSQGTVDPQHLETLAKMKMTRRKAKTNTEANEDVSRGL